MGMMNYPASDVFGEIRWAALNGFDFLDFTVEPPLAYADQLNCGKIRTALKKSKLGVVGHTAYYFPIASPIKSLRETSVKEIIKCMKILKKIGAEKINIHPDFRHPHFFSTRDVLGFNIESLGKIVAAGKTSGLDVMLENLNSDIAFLDEIFSVIPELKFHFDLGHANLLPGECSAEKILLKFSGRLAHVHLSDNKGGYDDLHIPLGTGNIDWEKALTALKKTGYDGTITLEVFSPDRDYLLLTKQKVQKFWLEG